MLRSLQDLISHLTHIIIINEDTHNGISSSNLISVFHVINLVRIKHKKNGQESYVSVFANPLTLYPFVYTQNDDHCLLLSYLVSIFSFFFSPTTRFQKLPSSRPGMSVCR